MTGKTYRLWFDSFPSLLLPVLLYNIVAFFSGGLSENGVPAIRQTLESSALSFPMLSGAQMEIGWGDIFVLVAIAFLFIELLKSTSTAASAIFNHMLSMGLFVICLIEFLLLANFATSTFFVMTAITLLDGLAGMAVTIVSARRDFGVQSNGGL